MKTKFWLLGIVVLLAAGGAWFAHSAWRAHRQLVTLNVRGMPLAKVLRKIEWQTWTHIRAEKSLNDVRVSLRVADKPLPYVLDRLAEQAGAHWSKLFAVYGSSSALTKLDVALSGNGQLKPAGWTRLVPKLPDVNPAVPTPGEGHFMLFRRTKDGTTILQNANGHTEVWSPEELVMESVLTARLGDEHSQSATSEAASEIARKVGGRWTTCLWFQKSSIGIMGAGMGFRGLPPVRFRAGQTNPEPANPGLAAPPAYNPNDRFAVFTPEQRVKLAREKEQTGGDLHFKHQ